MARRRLGEVLLEEGLIDEQELAEALRYKEKSGYRLGTALVALRIIAEWQLTAALGKALEVEVVDLARVKPSKSALERIPQRLAERFDLVPLRLEGRGRQRQLVVAMSDPLNRAVVARMREIAALPIKPVLASLSAIQRTIRECYHQGQNSRTLRQAERASAQARDAGAGETGRPASGPGRLPLAASGGDSTAQLEARLAGLEAKFRALLHVLLKRGRVSEKEYIRALQQVQQASRYPGDV